MRMRVGVVFLLLVVGAATSLLMSPGDNVDSSALAVEPAAQAAPGSAAMRVYLDPETGEIASEVPSAVVELDPVLENALRHDDEGLVVKHHPNGAVSMNLQERYQEATVVRIDANGKAVICTDNVANLERTLTDTSPVTPEVK